VSTHDDLVDERFSRRTSVWWKEHAAPPDEAARQRRSIVEADMLDVAFEQASTVHVLESTNPDQEETDEAHRTAG
jgi:hypothetical protein